MVIKHYFFFVAIVFAFTTSTQVLSQTPVRTMNGNAIELLDIINPKEPTILIFSKLNDFLEMMGEIQTCYEHQLKPNDVQLIIILNDAVKWTEVKPCLFGRCCALEVFIDENQYASRHFCITTSLTLQTIWFNPFTQDSTRWCIQNSADLCLLYEQFSVIISKN